jgi:hypothetical protein
MTRPSSSILAAVMLSAAAGAASADPLVEIRNAAVRVVVVPEARADIDIKVLKANPKLPLFIGTMGEATVLDGHLSTWFLSCHGRGRDLRARIMDRGEFSYDDLPQVIIRTPMNVRVETGGLGAGGVVSGAIGRSHSVSLRQGACGDWTVANVEDRLEAKVGGSGDISTGTAASADLVISGSGRLRAQAVRGDLRARVSGSGHVDVASAGSADLVISGSGDVHTGPVADGLRASISGSGDLSVERLGGAFDANVSGVGDIKVAEGRVTTMRTRISGSGDVSFGGEADSLQAVISGRGDVRVSSVKGDVDKHVSGSGEVHIGP